MSDTTPPDAPRLRPLAEADKLRPLSQWPQAERAAVDGVCTDIDDTLTTHGDITADALAALHALRAAGVRVLALTGRPVGWAEARARQWPVDAVIAENGTVALVPMPPSAAADSADSSSKNGPSPAYLLDVVLQKSYRDDAATRERERERLHAVARRVMREVPGAVLARDSAGRETDIAFDHGEFQQLPPATVDAIEALMRAEGLHTTRSSIHTHGAVSPRDKWAGACWAVRSLLGRDLAQELHRWVAVGDSGNDEALFQHFRHSVGVANIAAAAPRMRHLPRWVTSGERGAGFAELAQALLDARR